MAKRPKYASFDGAWTVEQATVPDEIDVRALRLSQRHGYGLTQAGFAKLYGFSLAAVQEWEQGRRKPGRTARILLELIRCNPQTVHKILGVPTPCRPGPAKAWSADDLDPRTRG